MFRLLTVVILGCRLSNPGTAQIKEIRRVLIGRDIAINSSPGAGTAIKAKVPVSATITRQ
jgi:hypothetical protein